MNREGPCNVQCVSTYISKRGIVHSAILVYRQVLSQFWDMPRVLEELDAFGDDLCRDKVTESNHGPSHLKLSRVLYMPKRDSNWLRLIWNSFPNNAPWENIETARSSHTDLLSSPSSWSIYDDTISFTQTPKQLLSRSNGVKPRNILPTNLYSKVFPCHQGTSPP